MEDEGRRMTRCDVPEQASSRLILLTNDDGIGARGLEELLAIVSGLADCVVVAPDSEQSGVSQAITLSCPPSVAATAPGRYAVKGTPVDCVNLALRDLLAARPSCVLSGINHGLNLGRDTSYSGTVAAALEAAGCGIPAVAFSCRSREGFPLHAATAAMVRGTVLKVLDHGLPAGICLNVNLPSGKPRGARLSALAACDGEEGWELRPSPDSGCDTPLRSASRPWPPDRPMLNDGWITLTPLSVNRTALHCFQDLCGVESVMGG